MGQEFKDSPSVCLSPALLLCMGASVEQAVIVNEILICILSSMLITDRRSYFIPILQTGKLRPKQVKWLTRDRM